MNEIINLFSKLKLLITPNKNISLQDIKAAKKYFDNLNDEKFIVIDNNFNVTPFGNNYNLTYQLPEDVKTK